MMQVIFLKVSNMEEMKKKMECKACDEDETAAT